MFFQRAMLARLPLAAIAFAILALFASVGSGMATATPHSSFLLPGSSFEGSPVPLLSLSSFSFSPHLASPTPLFAPSALFSLPLPDFPSLPSFDFLKGGKGPFPIAEDFETYAYASRFSFSREGETLPLSVTGRVLFVALFLVSLSRTVASSPSSERTGVRGGSSSILTDLFGCWNVVDDLSVPYVKNRGWRFARMMLVASLFFSGAAVWGGSSSLPGPASAPSLPSFSPTLVNTLCGASDELKKNNEVRLVARGKGKRRRSDCDSDGATHLVEAVVCALVKSRVARFLWRLAVSIVIESVADALGIGNGVFFLQLAVQWVKAGKGRRGGQGMNWSQRMVIVLGLWLCSGAVRPVLGMEGVGSAVSGTGAEGAILLSEAPAQIRDALLAMRNGAAELDLSNQTLDNADVMYLARELRNNNTTLTSLNLSGCNVGEMGALEIRAALRENKMALTSLNLSGCNIGVMGVHELGGGLRHNTTLTSLNLSGCYLGKMGARVLGIALESNTALITLYCDGGEHEIGQALLHNSTRLRFVLNSLSLPEFFLPDTEPQNVPLADYLNSVPPEIRGDLQRSAQYIKDKFVSGSVSLRHLRLVFIGPPGAGKSTLAATLREASTGESLSTEEPSSKWDRRNWHPDPISVVEPTVGLDLIHFTAAAPDLPPESQEKFHFACLDFGGDEVYERTHELFIDERCLFLSVSDLTKIHEEREVRRRWLRTVRRVAPSARVIILGTRAGEYRHNPKAMTNKLNILRDDVKSVGSLLCDSVLGVDLAKRRVFTLEQGGAVRSSGGDCDFEKTSGLLKAVAKAGFSVLQTVDASIWQYVPKVYVDLANYIDITRPALGSVSGVKFFFDEIATIGDPKPPFLVANRETRSSALTYLNARLIVFFLEDVGVVFPDPLWILRAVYAILWWRHRAETTRTGRPAEVMSHLDSGELSEKLDAAKLVEKLQKVDKEKRALRGEVTQAVLDILLGVLLDSVKDAERRAVAQRAVMSVLEAKGVFVRGWSELYRPLREDEDEEFVTASSTSAWNVYIVPALQTFGRERIDRPPVTIPDLFQSWAGIIIECHVPAAVHALLAVVIGNVHIALAESEVASTASCADTVIEGWADGLALWRPTLADATLKSDPSAQLLAVATWEDTAEGGTLSLAVAEPLSDAVGGVEVLLSCLEVAAGRFPSISGRGDVDVFVRCPRCLSRATKQLPQLLVLDTPGKHKCGLSSRETAQCPHEFPRWYVRERESDWRDESQRISTYHADILCEIRRMAQDSWRSRLSLSEVREAYLEVEKWRDRKSVADSVARLPVTVIQSLGKVASEALSLPVDVKEVAIEVNNLKVRIEEAHVLLTRYITCYATCEKFPTQVSHAFDDLVDSMFRAGVVLYVAINKLQSGKIRQIFARLGDNRKDVVEAGEKLQQSTRALEKILEQWVQVEV
eukprot:TRINITY_DN91_c0_g3_i1.p1 TRINITY_DN91_c0_g3~~TRINITY_DN91_c0_g3_i1.p1  ORF type:complete len:1427 (+),score=-72.80 TRINITY_DN91_c0_g3_i1:350-4630(+)